MTDSGSLPRFVREAMQRDDSSLAHDEAEAAAQLDVESLESTWVDAERSLLALEDALSDVVEVEAVHVRIPASTIARGPARLTSSVLDAPHRYAPFFARTALFLGVSEDAVIADLTRLREPVRWRTTGLPGVFWLAIQAGPAYRGAKAALIRIDPGATRTENRAGRTERVLVLEGNYVDQSGVQHRAGDVHEWSGAAGYSLSCGSSDERCLMASLVLGRDLGSWMQRLLALMSR